MSGPQEGRIMAVLNVTNTVTHWMLGGISICAFIFANSFSVLSSSLSQHIYLCVVGYVILMSIAVTSLSPYTSITKTLNQKQKRIVHGVLQVIGSTLAIAGSILRISDVDNSSISAHGVFGIIAMILTFLSLIGGVVNLFAQQLRLNPGLIKICHICLGCATIFAAFLCLILGFSHNIYKNFLGNRNIAMAVTFSVFALIGVFISPCFTLFKRFF